MIDMSLFHAPLNLRIFKNYGIIYCRNGCRPFVEVYVNEERILTTSQEYEKMR